jgi:hypothetical protein
MKSVDDLELYLKRVRIFLSHSKHDDYGQIIAEGIRSSILAENDLDAFFDVVNIPPGVKFADVLVHNISVSAVVAIHTDSYSSREWCRREVLEAKRFNVPFVIANCIMNFEERGFPYMGNVPVIRMEPDAEHRISFVIGRLLDEILKAFLWKCRIELVKKNTPSNIEFLPRAPELISVVTLLKDRTMAPRTVIYPDPPLGAEELALFESLSSDLTLFSYTEWLASLTAWDAMDKHRFLQGSTVALSISDSPDLARIGLTDDHTRDVAIELARFLMAAGAQLLYGGDLRATGYAELLLEVAVRHYAENSDRRIAFKNYLPWPAHVNINAKEWEARRDGFGSQACLLRLSLHGDILADTALFEGREVPASEWSAGLSAMRQRVTKESDARIALGGQTQNYRGRMPGVAEEVLVTLEARKAVFLVGGFGGCAQDIAASLGLPTQEGPRREWSGRDLLRKFTLSDLRNGLETEENYRLARTVHADEIVTLILRGLRRLMS